MMTFEEKALSDYSNLIWNSKSGLISCFSKMLQLREEFSGLKPVFLTRKALLLWCIIFRFSLQFKRHLDRRMPAFYVPARNCVTEPNCCCVITLCNFLGLFTGADEKFLRDITEPEFNINSTEFTPSGLLKPHYSCFGLGAHQRH